MSPSTYIRFTRRLLPKQHRVRAIPLRNLSQSHRPCWPKKESQERETIDTESTEYTKSDTDDSAAHSKVAFDSTTRSPEDEKAQASKQKRGSGSPLEVSPANQDISKPKTESAGPGRPPDKTRRSGTQKLDENNKGSTGGSGRTR